LVNEERVPPKGKVCVKTPPERARITVGVAYLYVTMIKLIFVVALQDAAKILGSKGRARWRKPPLSLGKPINLAATHQCLPSTPDSQITPILWSMFLGYRMVSRHKRIP
jgi:hypothetical protein